VPHLSPGNDPYHGRAASDPDRVGDLHVSLRFMRSYPIQSRRNDAGRQAAEPSRSGVRLPSLSGAGSSAPKHVGGRESALCTICAAAITRRIVCWRLKTHANLTTANFSFPWPPHGSRSPGKMRRWTICLSVAICLKPELPPGRDADLRTPSKQLRQVRASRPTLIRHVDAILLRAVSGDPAEPICQLGVGRAMEGIGEALNVNQSRFTRDLEGFSTVGKPLDRPTEGRVQYCSPPKSFCQVDGNVAKCEGLGLRGAPRSGCHDQTSRLHGMGFGAAQRRGDGL
jgi:hypothetical protein